MYVLVVSRRVVLHGQSMDELMERIAKKFDEDSFEYRWMNCLIGRATEELSRRVMESENVECKFVRTVIGPDGINTVKLYGTEDEFEAELRKFDEQKPKDSYWVVVRLCDKPIIGATAKELVENFNNQCFGVYDSNEVWQFIDAGILTVGIGTRQLVKEVQNRTEVKWVQMGYEHGHPIYGVQGETSA